MNKWSYKEALLLDEAVLSYAVEQIGGDPEIEEVKPSWTRIAEIHNQNSGSNRSPNACRHKYHDIRSEVLLEGLIEVSDYEWKLGLKKLRQIAGPDAVKRIKNVIQSF
jgi:hypothetical protein